MDELFNELLRRAIAESEKDSKQREWGDTMQRYDAPPAVMGAEPLNPLMTLFAGQALDTASTYNFLKRKTGREDNAMFSNVLTQEHPENALIGGAAGAAGYYLAHKLLSKISPRLADTAAGIVGGYHMGLGGENFDPSRRESWSDGIFAKLAAERNRKNKN
jgi:hypothetical protein